MIILIFFHKITIKNLKNTSKVACLFRKKKKVTFLNIKNVKQITMTQ